MRRWLRPARGERGSATVFVLGFATVLLVGAGLVIDGGLALNKRAQVTDDCEQAARVGANAIDVPVLRERNVVEIDEGQAISQATAFLSARGYTNIDVRVNGLQVTASADSKVDTVILGLIGIGSIPVDGDAVAEPEFGIG